MRVCWGWNIMFCIFICWLIEQFEINCLAEALEFYGPWKALEKNRVYEPSLTCSVLFVHSLSHWRVRASNKRVCPRKSMIFIQHAVKWCIRREWLHLSKLGKLKGFFASFYCRIYVYLNNRNKNKRFQFGLKIWPTMDTL